MMAYFPFFVDLNGKTGLIVGGGAVALRKARKLLPYGPRLTVAAPEIRPEFRELEAVELRRRPFAAADLDGCDFAVAGWVIVPEHPVVAFADNLSVLYDDRTEGSAVSFAYSIPGLFNRQFHIIQISHLHNCLFMNMLESFLGRSFLLMC